MAQSRETVGEAFALEFEAVEGIEAALSEHSRGEAELSVGLLLEAIEKERESLYLLEQGVDTLRQSMEQRRRAIDQQLEILNDLSACLSKERS
jgi:hypothetical protein